MGRSTGVGTGAAAGEVGAPPGASLRTRRAALRRTAHRLLLQDPPHPLTEEANSTIMENRLN